jgi:ATP-dependent RNA helicase RhlE
LTPWGLSIRFALNDSSSQHDSPVSVSPDAPQGDGPAAPAPAVVEFADFGLAEPILRAVTQMGYRTPTPIQAQAIPVVMRGADVMGAAQTGTGKTAGFALPILQRLIPTANASASPLRHPTRALILAPTRELADQIHDNVAAYAKYTQLRSAVVFGGVDIKPQIAAVRVGVEVLIATPGRLLDHVEQKTVNLSQVEIFVMDEADRMLDMGFLPDIQRIINLLPRKRQNLMFSATFSNEIRKLAESFLSNPILIEVARRNATSENVEQRLYLVRDNEAKRAAVAQLVRDRGLAQVIVFSNTKIGCGRLARELERDGLNAAAIHGDKSQQERLATLEAFKKGEISVLVATDVAARGLDIAELPAVINYDLPYSAEDYIHRIGRTGRAGASGVALSLMTNAEERQHADIEKLIKRKLQPEPLAVEDPYRIARAVHTERKYGEDAAPRSRRPQHRMREAAPVPGALPGHSQDPFFYQPYAAGAGETEPVAGALATGAMPSGPVAGRPSHLGSITGVNRGRRPIPVLLGGPPKR